MTRIDSKTQRVKQLVIRFLVLLFSVSAAFAQIPAPPPGNPPLPPPEAGQPVFSQEELDQMLAPIALYPDALLSQILMAATYPLEVVEAARWSRANANLRGDQAVNAIAQTNWDPSVKSLVAFPQIIQMMDEKLDWTQRLGDAFLSQQPQVMDTVQNLRQRAYAAGNLQSNERMRVTEQPGQPIVVEPANPEVIYVPYYDPRVIYGPWWWPAYSPVYWRPWPGYYVRPGITVGFFFGFGIAVSTHFFFGEPDWHARRVNVLHVDNHYFNYNAYENRHRAIYHDVNVKNNRVAWGHDPAHRRGTPYRSVALRQQFGRVNTAPDTRREFRGYAPSSSQGSPEHVIQQAPREAGGKTPSQPVEQRGSTRTIVGSAARKPDTGAAPSRPSTAPATVSRVEPRIAPHPAAPTVQPQPTIFEGVSYGAKELNHSARGRQSYQAAASKPSVPAAGPSGHVPAVQSSGKAPASRPAGNSGGGGEKSRQ